MAIRHELAPVPGLRLGLRPTDPARLEAAMTLPLRTGFTPPHPLAADHITAVRRWVLGGNDQFGTCGPTSVANYLVLLHWYLTGELISVTDEAVFALYRASGNPDFDPATGAGDNGVDMTVMLSALLTVGLDITHADGTTENIKPLCYAKFPAGNLDDIRAVTDIFGATIWAVNLLVAQQAQTGGVPPVWDYVAGSPEWGGHAVAGGAYTSVNAPHRVDLTDVSWEIPIGTTDAFLSEQLQEVYCVVWPLLWNQPGFEATVDKPQLAADYTAVTGKPFPVPVPAPPAPVPPGPVPASLADQALAAYAEPWISHRHTGDNARMASKLRTWLHDKGF